MFIVTDYLNFHMRIEKNTQKKIRDIYSGKCIENVSVFSPGDGDITG